MLLVQLIGLIGVCLVAITFQLNKRTTMLRVMILGCLAWTVHYALLGAYTGAGMSLLTVARNVAFERYRKFTWIYQISIIAYAITTLVTWRDWTSILPLLGSILATTAMWQKKPRYIRLISLTVTPFWLSYNYLNASYMGMTADLLTFASVAIGVCRFDLMPILRKAERETDQSEVVDAGLV
jgi:hypothetical protein